MGKNYEYKFVRMGEYWGSALFGVRDRDRDAYEAVVQRYADDGWRLVQIFAPGLAAFGAARYFELIFERDSSSVATVQGAPTDVRDANALSGSRSARPD
jgi:hypothetical protein